MKGRFWLPAILAPVLIAALVFLARRDAAGAGPVYSVAQVVQGLARHPAAWVDHTVRVRGIALPEAITTTAYRDCSTRGVPCEVSLYPVVDRVNPIGSPVLSFAAPARSAAGDFVDSHAAVLLVRPDYKSDMLGMLRHVPLLGQYMPRPQRLSFAARVPSIPRAPGAGAAQRRLVLRGAVLRRAIA